MQSGPLQQTSDIQITGNILLPVVRPILVIPQQQPSSDVKDVKPPNPITSDTSKAPTPSTTKEQKSIPMPVINLTEIKIEGKLEQTKNNTFEHEVHKASYAGKNWFLKKAIPLTALQGYLACAISHDFIPDQPAVKLVEDDKFFYILLEEVPDYTSFQEYTVGCCNWLETWFGCSCCNEDSNLKKLILEGKLPYFNELMAHVSLTINSDARPTNIGTGSRPDKSKSARLIDQDQSFNEGRYYGCGLKVMSSAPTQENLPAGTRNYIFVQTSPGLPPTEFYFVQRGHPHHIQKIPYSQYSDSLIKALYPGVTNHQYTTQLNLSNEKLEAITNTTGHSILRRSTKITAEDIARAPFLDPDGFYPYNHTTNINGTERLPEQYNSLLSLKMVNNPLYCDGYYSRLLCNLLLKPFIKQYVDLRFGDDPKEELTDTITLSQAREFFTQALQNSIDAHEKAAMQVFGFREFLKSPAAECSKQSFLAAFAKIKRDDGVTLLSRCPENMTDQIDDKFKALRKKLQDDSIRIIRAKVVEKNCATACADWCSAFCCSRYDDYPIIIEIIRPGIRAEIKAAPNPPAELPGQVSSMEASTARQQPITLVIPTHLRDSPIHSGIKALPQATSVATTPTLRIS